MVFEIAAEALINIFATIYQIEGLVAWLKTESISLYGMIETRVPLHLYFSSSKAKSYGYNRQQK